MAFYQNPNDLGNMALDVPNMPMLSDAPPPPVEVSQQIEEAPPWVPSKKLQEEVTEYVVRFCNESADYIREYIDHWSLLDDLHNNKIGPREWATKTSKFTSTSQSRIEDSGSYKQQAAKWFSNLLYSPRDLTQKVVAAMYAAIFSGPDYLTITVEENQNLSEGSGLTSPEDPKQFPIAMRAQEFLKSYLKSGGIHARIDDCLTQGVLYGTLAAKVSWSKRTTARRQPDGTRLTEVLEEFPVVDPIPLDLFLPDPQAKHGDTRRWRMVGHRVDRTFDEVSEAFYAGTYTLGENEFRKRWKSTGGSKPAASEITGEGGNEAVSTETTWLRLWEVHGQIVTSEGIFEGSATLVTDTSAEHCDDGLLIRFTDEPVLDSNERPIVVWHFSPEQAPLGKGLIDCNEDLIYAISQFINQLQDNTRLTAIGAWQGPKNSSQYRYIQQNGGTIWPGMFAAYDNYTGDEIKPLTMPQFNAQVILEVIQFLIGLLEKRTITQAFQGMPGGRKTAFEAQQLQQQSQQPVETRTDLLARTLLEPVFNLCMGMLCQFKIGDQSFPVRDATSQIRMVTITADELKNHKYVVTTTLTRQDASRIARSQSLERIMKLLAEYQPLIMQSGTRKVDFAELALRLLDTVSLDGLDRVMPMLTPEDLQAMMQPPPGPPGQVPPQPGGPPPMDQGGQPPMMGEGGGPIGDQSNLDAITQLLQSESLNAQGGGM